MVYHTRCRRGVGLFAVLALVTSLAIAFTTPADARRHNARQYGRSAGPTTPTDPSKDAALIIDGTSGKILYARNQNDERHPASLTKMMTLYLLFDAIKKGQLSLNSTIPISAHAASQRPTNLHLHSGDQINVDLAIKAVVVRSANDVAAAIAEALGGTEGHFAEMMTAKARALGMRNTFYHNASGLPDNLQITTASDLAILARHVAYDFPQYYHYFSTPAFSFRGVDYVTHDNLIGRYRGTDGIKTGYTGASGFNLVSSVVRDNTHIIGVVMGGRSATKRDREMMRLLDLTFTATERDPTLVARAQVPWQVALNTTPNPLLAQSGTFYSQPSGPVSDTDDEDTAERKADVDEGGSDTSSAVAANTVPLQQMVTPGLRFQSKLPVTAALQLPRQPAQNQRTAAAAVASVALHPIPATKPVIQPQPSPPRTVVAAAQPKPSSMRSVILGEGDAGDNGTLRATFGLHDWTIQIGAFADLTLARTQLAAYAEKAMDVLGQAQRIVVPFQSVDGHTLYRARFGPFAEREARQICTRLTERGQTCFASISSR